MKFVFGSHFTFANHVMEIGNVIKVYTRINEYIKLVSSRHSFCVIVGNCKTSVRLEAVFQVTLNDEEKVCCRFFFFQYNFRNDRAGGLFTHRNPHELLHKTN